MIQILGDLSGLYELERDIKILITITKIVLVILAIVLYIIESSLTSDSIKLRKGKSNILVWFPILRRYYLTEQATNWIVGVIYTIASTLILLFPIVYIISYEDLPLIDSIGKAGFVGFYIVVSIVDLVFYSVLKETHRNEKRKQIEAYKNNSQQQNN
jgi:hypothetical protein